MIIDWPENNQDNSAKRVWADVTRHCARWRDYWFSGDYQTTSHETTHGANADIRNSLGGRINAFYILDNKAVVSPEPSFSKSAVAQYVPDNLHGVRYNTYVTGMTEWNDRPLYLWDEWSAYVNGCLCATELKQLNEYKGDWSDWSMGPLEFNIYGLAVMTAARYNDSNGYEALKEDFRLLWSRSWRTFYAGKDYFPWDTQDTYLANCLSMRSNELIKTLEDLQMVIPIMRK